MNRSLADATLIVNTLLDVFRRKKLELMSDRQNNKLDYNGYLDHYHRAKAEIHRMVFDIFQTLSWEDQIHLASRFPDIGYLTEYLDDNQLAALRIML